MQSSERQRLYIANIIKRNHAEYSTLKAIWEATPKNNTKYPNEKADYKQLILADNLSPLSSQQASYIIKAMIGEKGYHLKTAFKMLTDLKLV